MKYLYLFLCTSLGSLTLGISSVWAQQTCSTNKAGYWNDPAVWDCGIVPGIGANTTFTGTINVNHALLFPDYSTIRITGQVTIDVSGAGSLDFGSGAGAGTKFEILNINSVIILRTTSNFIKGGNNASIINVGDKLCGGPFNGSYQLNNRTISYASPACANAVLPVTLLSFTAKAEADRVQLAWSTTSEQNADRFVVERSTDLGEYSIVGDVAAKGTTDTRQYYGLTDEQPLPGINYYRLRQIDRTGLQQTFKPISVVVDPESLAAVVYPNPTSDSRIHLRLRNAADNATLRLLTLTGQAIDGKIERRQDDVEVLLQRPLPLGVYLLEVQSNGQKRVVNVLIR
ncbi:T9SS type A sorting domain-containing protein [Fibrella sp. ES10-3-2-2]